MIQVLNTSLKIAKRYYHPGYSPYRKMALPLCPLNNISKYYKPVWGNKIQEIQLNNKIILYNSYITNHINIYSKLISNHFNNNVYFLPTSHNTPISTALYSCRNLDANKFLSKIDNTGISVDEVFVNTQENKKKLLSILKYCDNPREYNTLNNAIYGIFSNFADSIYIANDYLQVGKNYLFVCNYPSKASQREIERSRIIATALEYGNMPILLDNHINFEGEANIKYIPAIIEENNQKYQLCLTYNSSRSELECIENMNKYLKKLNVPLLKEIRLHPIKGYEKYFYHQDCIINFYSENKLQIFNSEEDFLNNYEKNGTAIVIKRGFDDNNLKILNRLFKKIIYVNMEDDLLSANMIVNKYGIIGSSNINNKTKKEIRDNFPFFYDFEHPSSGGGGAHKCCSNVISKRKPISVSEWVSFIKDLGIEPGEQLIQGVKNELHRLYSSCKNIF